MRSEPGFLPLKAGISTASGASTFMVTWLHR
jgi:hypothetical protein